MTVPAEPGLLAISANTLLFFIFIFYFDEERLSWKIQRFMPGGEIMPPLGEKNSGWPTG